MGDFEEMRAMNKKVIDEVGSTKTLSGGSPAKQTPDERRAANKAKLEANDASMKTKAKAQQKQQHDAWEAKRSAAGAGKGKS